MTDPMRVISAAETCYKYGKLIVRFCQDWKNADKEMTERVNILESSWVRTRDAIRLAERLLPIMDVEAGRILDDSIYILQGKLLSTGSKIEKLQKKASPYKLGFFNIHEHSSGVKFALKKKKDIDKLLDELERWVQRIEPQISLAMRKPDPKIDKVLIQVGATATKRPTSLVANIRRAVTSPDSISSVVLPPATFQTRLVHYSRVEMGMQAGEGKHYILDTLVVHPNSDIKAMDKDISRLASKLTLADAFSFGLLRCKGFSYVHEE